MRLNSVQRWVARSIAIALVSTSLVGSRTQATPQVRFEPPEGGAPVETKGGASRGDIACATSTSRDTPQIVLVTPANSNYGLTTSEHPTFLMYVPPSSAQKAFFSIKNAKGQVHYRQLLTVPQQGGILRLTLPKSVPSLAANQSYEWGIVLMCGGRLRPDSPFASGWIQRIQLANKVSTNLKKQSAMDQAATYGASGIWYDMISTIADLKQQQPQDPAISQTWRQILDAAGLTKITPAPIVN